MGVLIKLIGAPMSSPRFLALLVALTLASGSALADRRHHRDHDGPRTRFSFGLSVGAPWPVYPGGSAGPRWPNYPAVRYSPVWVPAPIIAVPPTVVVMRPAPTVYVERTPLVASPSPVVPALEPGFWYYCYEAQAYYPQVRQCPGDWRKVAPLPAE